MHGAAMTAARTPVRCTTTTTGSPGTTQFRSGTSSPSGARLAAHAGRSSAGGIHENHPTPDRSAHGAARDRARRPVGTCLAVSLERRRQAHRLSRRDKRDGGSRSAPPGPARRRRHCHPARRLAAVPFTALLLAWGGHSGGLHAPRNTVGSPLLGFRWRSEEHTSELQSLMRNSYAVFCLKK